MGKLAKVLRLMGYDTVFFSGSDDSRMVAIALKEGRVILTRDTQIMKRRVIANGRARAVLFEIDDPRQQIRQVIRQLKLDCQFRPFTICLECNQPLAEKTKDEVEGRVPPYVFRTQSQYMECPACRRIYWRGTHWEAMTGKLKEICQQKEEANGNI